MQITLQEGCQLKGALLPQQHSQRRKPFKINVPAATVQHWSAPEEAAAQSKNDMSVLCLPHSKSEPAIDAISSPALYWQVRNALSSLYRHIERGSSSMHACGIGSTIVPCIAHTVASCYDYSRKRGLLAGRRTRILYNSLLVMLARLFKLV